MWVCFKSCCFFSCFGISSGPSKYKICNTWPSWCFADSDNLLKGQGFGSACLKHSDMVEQTSGQHVVGGGKCLCAACPWDKDFMWLENLSGLSSCVLVTSSARPMIIAALVEVRPDVKIRCFYRCFECVGRSGCLVYIVAVARMGFQNLRYEPQTVSMSWVAHCPVTIERVCGEGIGGEISRKFSTLKFKTFKTCIYTATISYSTVGEPYRLWEWKSKDVRPGGG